MGRIEWKEIYEEFSNFPDEKRREILESLLKFSRKERENFFRNESYAIRVYVEKAKPL
ncbi:MAG: hypothetical protein ACP5PQ_06650 [Thermoproteota archaeon]